MWVFGQHFFINIYLIKQYSQVRFGGKREVFSMKEIHVEPPLHKKWLL